MVKILLAVDGSEGALRAARHLVKSAAWYKQAPEVHVIAAHRAVPMAGRAEAALGSGALNHYYKEESEMALKGAREVLTLAGIAFTEHSGIGEPAEIIVKLAHEQGCDLIYMGTRGLGAVKSLVLGSTAQKVLHLTETPVVLVH